MRSAPPDAMLAVRGLSKTFPGQRALHTVDLDVRAGEIHTLLGQNGSGKSTLIKILAGFHQPDAGASVRVGGQVLDTSVPGAAQALGLRFVHQDLALVATLSLVDNLALGRGYRTGRFGRIRWRDEAAAATAALADVGLDVDPFTSLDLLSMAERTGVAVARAIHSDAAATRVLVLDEPTASLPATEVDRLFTVLRRLRDRGVAILLVSHHLDEVLAIADRVTVLRDGHRVASVPRDEVDHDRLVELIVGRSMTAATRRPLAAEIEDDSDDRCLRVVGLAGDGVSDFSTVVSAGEVVGVAGLEGSGRGSIVPLLTGQLPRAAGTVAVGTTPVPPGSPRASLRAGMAFVPSDRAHAGVFATWSVRENLTIAHLQGRRRSGRLPRRPERAETRDWIERLQVVATGTEAPIATLSGGNQQKVLLGRSLRLAPTVMLLDEPTQGVDVGARGEVHRILDEAVRRGMGLLVASTDSEELVRLCDRVHVLQAGRAVRTLHRGHDLTVEELDHAQISRPDQEVAS